MSTEGPIAVTERPHAEARVLLATGAPVYISVNPTEYHGPHLSLHNDKLVSAGLLRDLHAALAVGHPDWPLLLGPNLEVGVEPAPGLGSQATPYKTVRDLVVETCRAVCDLGAQRLVLMTFHGSPLHSLALEAGIEHCRSRGVPAYSPLNLVLRELLTLDTSHPDQAARFAPAFAHLDDPAQRKALLHELPFDYHAGFFETSAALHYAPHTVSAIHRELPPCPAIEPDRFFMRAARVAELGGRAILAAELRFAAFGVGWFALRPFPGYTGQPALATAAAGAVFAREMVAQFADVGEQVLAGQTPSPRPIMPWMLTASLGGRLGARVPADAFY